PALVESSRLMPVLATIDKNWREGSENSGTTYQNVRQVLLGGAPQSLRSQGPLAGFGKKLKTRARRLAPIRVLSPPVLKRALFDRFPSGGVFIHTTHYPFEYLFRWLEVRRDVKAVFFVHDLLPLEFPEYFERTHIAWHRRSLEIFARFGYAAIVNTHFV